jgi:hypothetical protein
MPNPRKEEEKKKQPKKHLAERMPETGVPGLGVPKAEQAMTATGRRAAMRAAAGLTSNAAAQAHAASIMSANLGQDHISDEQARARSGLNHIEMTEGVTPEVPNPENLPAVINQAMTQSGVRTPEWTMVRDLPGYMANSIRVLGRQVFNQFTDTPVEDIQAVTTLTHSDIEVRSLMSWIRKNGVCDDSAHMDFDNVMPGYTAKTRLWKVKDYDFLLVEDMGGKYVYGWPGGRGVHLDNQPAPRIGGR